MQGKDPEIQCPYNKSHVIRTSRMQVHLIKCKRNYPLAEKMVCPFNAVHHVDKPDYQYHVSTCPDRRVIEGHKYEVQESVHGDLQLAPYNEPELPIPEENWDAETQATTYDPSEHIEAAPIVRMLNGATKSERKAFRLRERLRLQRLKDGDTHDDASAPGGSQPGPSVTEDVMKPLRLPRKTSEALRLLNPNMGLGRGINPNRTEEVAPGGRSLVEGSSLELGQGPSTDIEIPIPNGIGRGRPLLNLK